MRETQYIIYKVPGLFPVFGLTISFNNSSKDCRFGNLFFGGAPV